MKKLDMPEKPNLNDLEIRLLLKDLISDFLMNKSHSPNSIKIFLSKLLDDYFSSKPQNLVDFLMDLYTRDKKFITFIRHGESEYNKWRSKNYCNLPFFYRNKPTNYDPKLSEEGKQQIENSREVNFKKFEEDQCFNIVYVSPLTRTIQTFNTLLKNEKIFERNCEFIACDLIRERMDFACDVGTSKEKLQETFKEINFSYIFDDSWWRHEEKDKNVKKTKEKVKGESKKKVYIRLLLFTIWILLKEQKRVLMVSHQNVFQCLFNNYKLLGKKIKNGEVQDFSFEQLNDFLLIACMLIKKKKL